MADYQQWTVDRDKAREQGHMAYVRWFYKVPARRGGRVRANGKLGTIRSANEWGQLRIRLDGERFIGTYHPKWHMEYL